MEPWQSWAVAIAGGGLAYYYYVHKHNGPDVKTRIAADANAVPVGKTSRRNDHGPRKNTAQLATATDVLSSDDQLPGAATTSRKRKAQPAKARTPIEFPEVDPAALASQNNDDENSKAWAQQLTDLRKGTKLNQSGADDKNKAKKHRTVKQSASAAASAVAAASLGSDASNLIEGSGDDAPSSAGSSAPNQAGDVSDMLDAPSAGPSVIRLTSTQSSGSNGTRNKAKEFEPAESKKQRQNRRKVEERKLEREAAEAERRVLMEQQRRTAREARGEPAKNGLAAPKPPANSAWAGSANGTGSVANDSVAHAPLLDTFDRDTTPVPPKSSANWQNALPSEDAQMRMVTQLSSDESGWATVSTKKKAKKPASHTSDGDFSEDASSIKANVKSVNARGGDVMTGSVPAAAGSTSLPARNSIYESLREQKLDVGSHPDDSQWAA